MRIPRFDANDQIRTMAPQITQIRTDRNDKCGKRERERVREETHQQNEAHIKADNRNILVTLAPVSL